MQSTASPGAAFLPAHLSFECKAHAACLEDCVALQHVQQKVVLLRAWLEGAPARQHVVKHVLRIQGCLREQPGWCVGGMVFV